MHNPPERTPPLVPTLLPHPPQRGVKKKASRAKLRWLPVIIVGSLGFLFLCVSPFEQVGGLMAGFVGFWTTMVCMIVIESRIRRLELGNVGSRILLLYFIYQFQAAMLRPKVFAQWLALQYTGIALLFLGPISLAIFRPSSIVGSLNPEVNHAAWKPAPAPPPGLQVANPPAPKPEPQVDNPPPKKELPKLKKATESPTAQAPEETVPVQYLADLQEFDVKPGPWPYTKNGQIGDGKTAIMVTGVVAPRSLGMHPPPRSYSAAKFHLDRQGTLFKATVALNDGARVIAAKAVFEVLGDGRSLWKSALVSRPGQPQECLVDVTGVDVLELRVHSQSTNNGLHAVWLWPRVLPKKDGPG